MSVNVTSELTAGAGAAGSVVVPEDYLRLIRQLPLWPIESAAVHRRALAMANALLEKKAKSSGLSRGEAGYLSVLIELIDDYEKAKHPRRKVGDDEMLEHLIEAKGVAHVQVERDTGIACADDFRCNRRPKKVNPRSDWEAIGLFPRRPDSVFVRGVSKDPSVGTSRGRLCSAAP